jgi:hypothetical protein
LYFHLYDSNYNDIDSEIMIYRRRRRRRKRRISI